MPDAASPISPRRQFACTACAAVLWWLSLPPVGWSWLGFVAATPLAYLAGCDGDFSWRDYRRVWLGGYLFWLAELYWLTLPYWATAFGWLLLAAYLAVYWPWLIAVTRIARKRCHLPLPVAFALAWVGMEWLQANVLGGFLMGALGHSQFLHLRLIQISHVLGAYGVSALLAFTGAAAACLNTKSVSHRKTTKQGQFGPAICALLLTAGTWFYGEQQLKHAQLSPGPRIALIQGSIDTEMKFDPEQQQQVFEEYFTLSQQAVATDPRPELLVWPETMFRFPLVSGEAGAKLPSGSTVTLEEAAQQSRDNLQDIAARLGVPLLLGIDSHFVHRDGEIDNANSAILVSRDGQLLSRYDKNHPVAFGEFTPLATWLPFLANLNPIGKGITPGPGPVLMNLDGEMTFSPSICYETAVPHLIPNQLISLEQQQRQRPTMLINLTNDGWFWGSSELDLHLICGVFRAVENRLPLAIAANTGFSAVIDPYGRIVDQGPRRQRGLIIQSIPLAVATSPVASPWPPFFWAELCGIGFVILLVIGAYDRLKSRAQTS